MATAGVLRFKGGVGAGPRVERSEPSVESSEPKGTVAGYVREGVRGGGTGGGGFVPTIPFKHKLLTPPQPPPPQM